MVPGAMADLVLLHGFTQTGRSWQPIGHALAGRYRAAAPDLPGHGAFARAAPGQRSPPATRTCARSPEEPYVLCGYSMGGRIALHAAFGLGDRVRRLVLIGASPGLADPAERAARAASDAALADRIEAIGIEAFAGGVGGAAAVRRACRAASPSSRGRTGAATPPPGSPPRCAGSAPA